MSYQKTHQDFEHDRWVAGEDPPDPDEGLPRVVNIPPDHLKGCKSVQGHGGRWYQVRPDGDPFGWEFVKDTLWLPDL